MKIWLNCYLFVIWYIAFHSFLSASFHTKCLKAINNSQSMWSVKVRDSEFFVAFYPRIFGRIRESWINYSILFFLWMRHSFQSYFQFQGIPNWIIKIISWNLKFDFEFDTWNIRSSMTKPLLVVEKIRNTAVKSGRKGMSAQTCHLILSLEYDWDISWMSKL